MEYSLKPVAWLDFTQMLWQQVTKLWVFKSEDEDIVKAIYYLFILPQPPMLGEKYIK